MADIFTEFQDIASELFSEFLGNNPNLTITTVRQANYNEDPVENVLDPVFGFKQRLGARDNQYLDSLNITTVVSKFIIAAKELGDNIIEIGDKLTFDSIDYKVEAINIVEPDGKPIVLTFFVSK